jgi:hypothetical protein
MITKNHLKMELLNSEEMSGLYGGIGNCTNTGDTIYKHGLPLVKKVIVVQCGSYELSCPSIFTMECGLGDCNCSGGFILKPI